jgi:diacylglycerol kinase (ATP)
MKKRILFIINPMSGVASKAGIPEAIDAYLDHDLYEYSIMETKYAGHAASLARDASEEGVDVVTAVGGDGTVNEVARGIVHTSTVLGIIPCGSGNGLARHLLLPLNVRKCIEIINRCEVHALDYGIINEYPFFCTCGMGFDAFVSQKFAEAGKRGPITYAQKILEEGTKYKPETYDVDADGISTSYKAFLISCANASQYGNNAYIAPQASMSDGFLDVVIMEPFDILDAPQIAIDMFSKTLDMSSKIKSFRTRHLHIRRAHPGVIHYDGDPVMTGADIDVRIEAKGINIIVNPDGDKRQRQPNVLQTAACELFNDLSAIRHDFFAQTKRGVRLAKLIQRTIERNLPGLN